MDEFTGQSLRDFIVSFRLTAEEAARIDAASIKLKNPRSRSGQNRRGLRPLPGFERGAGNRYRYEERGCLGGSVGRTGSIRHHP